MLPVHISLYEVDMVSLYKDAKQIWRGNMFGFNKDNPEDYGLEIIPYNEETEEDNSILIPIDKDLIAGMSVYTHAIPQLAVSKIGYDALNQTAYSIKFNGENVLPNQLYQKNNKSYISNMKGDGKKWGSQTDVDPIDFTKEKGAMVAGAAFAVASVATSQYYLKNIDDKLEELKKVTKQVLDFLEQDKQSEVEGEIKYLGEVFNSLSLIKEDESLRIAKLHQVETIERESTDNTIFYEKEVRKLINEYESKKTKKKSEKDLVPRLMSAYYYLNLSMRANGLAKLLEIYMVDGLKKEYVENKRSELQESCVKLALVDDLIATKIPERDKQRLGAFVQKGLSSALNYLGDSIEMSPIGYLSLDEKLHELSDIQGEKVELQSNMKVASILEYGDDSTMDSYVNNIKQVEYMYDNPVELVFKDDEMFVKMEKAG